jgi:sugar lactone lactonase YvrE
MGCTYDGSVLYISDSPGNQIYKINNYPDKSATYSVFLDSTRVSSPTKLIVDGQNNLYFTQANKKTITKISPAANLLDTISFSSILNPTSFTLAPDQKTLYILDTTHHSIYRIDSSSTLTLFAGGNVGNADGTGTAAQFNNPIDLVCDSKGNIYVTDTGLVGILAVIVQRFNWTLRVSSGTIRKITPAGVVTTFIKGLNHPREICIDAADNLYISELGSNIIRKVTPAGISYLHSGKHFIPSKDGVTMNDTFTKSWGSHSNDLDSKNITFRGVHGMAVDGVGTVYVSDVGNKVVRRIRGGIGPVPQKPIFGMLSGTYSAKTFIVPQVL